MSNNDPYPIQSSQEDREIRTYLGALGKHWVGIVGAIVGSFSLILIEKLCDVSIPPIVYAIVVVVGVAVASFFAWRDQFRGAQIAREENLDLKAKLQAKSALRMEIQFPQIRLEHPYLSEPNLEAKVKNVSESSIDGLGMIIESVVPLPKRGILTRTTDAKFPWPLKTSEKVHRLNPEETFSIPIGAAKYSSSSYALDGEKYCILRMANLDGSLSESFASFEFGKDYTMTVRATAHDYKGPLLQYVVHVERHSNEDREWHLLKITKTSNAPQPH